MGFVETKDEKGATNSNIENSGNAVITRSEEETNLQNIRDTTTKSDCPNRYHDEKNSADKKTKKVKWTTLQMEVVNLIYNLGYMIGHVPGAFVALHFGIHSVMFFTMFVCSSLTLCIIWTNGNFTLILIIRLLCGIICGSVYPIINESIAVYCPKKERPAAHMSIHSGLFVSSLIVFPAAGRFIQYFEDGWKLVFISTSSLGFISSLLWAIFVWSEPDQNVFMSIKEQDFIRNSLYPTGKPKKITIMTFPIREMIMDKHLLIFSSVNFAALIIVYMNLLGVVMYFKTYFLLGPYEAGLYGVIPFMAECIFQLSYSSIIKFVTPRNFSNTTVRRINTLIGAIGCSLFSFCSGFIGCEYLSAGIVLQTLSLMFYAPYQFGYSLAIVERYARFAGLVYAFINIAGSLSGVVQRCFLITLKQYFSIHEAYRWSFIITALVSFLFSLPYLIFGTAERAQWVDPHHELEIKAGESEENI